MGIGPAFIKHAVSGGTAHTSEHVLARLLGRLFRTVLRSGPVPAAGKVARLTPLFKKGDRSEPRKKTPNCCQFSCVSAFCGGSKHAVDKVVSKAKCVSERAVGVTYWSKTPTRPVPFPGRRRQQAQSVLRHIA
jgi:hypothetical protein